LNLLLVGLSHHTAPVECRERLAAVDQSPERTLAGLLALPRVKEGFYLATCNRVEFLLVLEAGAEAEAAAAGLVDFLARASGLEPADFRDDLYVKSGREAVRHVFRVAASLDSMVVGEPQILGQIKAAYRQASAGHALGVVLNRLMHKTFSTAKRVRTETGISDHAVSVSYAAVELARKIFGHLDDKEVLLIGAGEMAELAAENLLAQGRVGLTVANRTLERALEVARRFDGRAVSLAELDEALVRADIVISSTASPEPVLTAAGVRAGLRPRKRRPLFIIDIAVPRDVEAGVGRLENVYLYDIDDLQAVVARNLEGRRQEAVRAERVVEEEAIKFQNWLETLAVVPTIKAIGARLEEVRAGELGRTLAAHQFSPEQEAALQAMSQAMMKKILHHPALLLKRNFKNPDNRTRYLDAAQRLFGLEADNLRPGDEEESG